jgi:hypothetical protein
VGEILLAGEEAQERPALLCVVITDGAAQHGVADLQRIEHRALRHRPPDFKFHVTANLRQGPEVGRKYDPDHMSLIMFGRLDSFVQI